MFTKQYKIISHLYSSLQMGTRQGQFKEGGKPKKWWWERRYYSKIPDTWEAAVMIWQTYSVLIISVYWLLHVSLIGGTFDGSTNNRSARLLQKSGVSLKAVSQLDFSIVVIF